MDNLYYSIIPGNPVYDQILISNLQYFRLNMVYLGKPLVANKSRLYLLLKGNNVLFNGNGVQFTSFTSLELPFGTYYKS